MDLDLENNGWAELFNKGPVCMFLQLNNAGEWPIVKITENVRNLTGWSDQDFLDGSVSFSALVHPDDRAIVGAAHDAWIDQNDGDTLNVDYRIVGKTGETKHVTQHAHLIRNDVGDVTHFVGYILDVTNHHLTVKEKKAAENADRAKSEFLANMSHEIRTPMNGVMGMAELLANTELDAKQQMFTDVIVKSGTSLLTIINDILDFSKLDAGQMELDPAPFCLSEAIEDVTTLVSAKVEEKDLELIMRIDPELPDMLVGDAGRIRQIITNLVGNAVKFTEKGHVYINVMPIGVSDSDTQNFRIEISDTGIGIPQVDLEKIFEKFSQVDASATRKHEGTGLGLSICSSLVKLMGGQIGVESEAGAGSTFWFELRLPVHKDKKAKRIPVDVSGSRVLIVDDNAINRSILTEQMTSWQFDSAAVDSGMDAIAVMRAADQSGLSIDCVILDYHMPQMNGGDVVKAMKEDPTIPNLPIVMLTSVNETEDKKTFSSLGIQGHLVKPARSSMLLEMLIEVLQEKQERDASAVSASSDTPHSGTPDAATNRLMVEAQNASATATDKPIEILNTPTVDVLVCEDNEVNQIVFSQVLDSIDVSYKIANNGEEGLSVYHKFSPKMILMDVSMPKKNGLETTKAIREIEMESHKHTPIVAVTAHAINGDSDKCFDAGMDDYMSKPISPNLLTEKVHKWLRSKSTPSISNLRG